MSGAAAGAAAMFCSRTCGSIASSKTHVLLPQGDLRAVLRCFGFVARPWI